MTRSIDNDLNRFKQIVRGKVRENLKKYITHGEMFGRQGRKVVSIPVPGIDIPHFRHGQKGSGGAGQGEGEIGQSIGQGDAEGDGSRQAGDQPGEGHFREVEVTLEELAAMLGEELELPRIEPRGKNQLATRKDKYNTIRRRGPESLRHLKRTYKNALKRMIATGIYDPENPVVIPERDDRLYRGANSVIQPETNAVLVYVMDVSGSMTDEQKAIVRIEAFWIDTWLRHQYKNLEVHYIVHDAVAHEVDQHTFFHLRESGGTKISSAYELCLQLMRDKYPAQEWNVYPFHFSDGDNWSTRDTEHCVSLLKDSMLPACNQFCYGQVKSAYGSGQFKKDLDTAFRGEEKVVTTDIQDRDGILPSIKSFLGRGR